MKTKEQQSLWESPGFSMLLGILILVVTCFAAIIVLPRGYAKPEFMEHKGGLTTTFGFALVSTGIMLVVGLGLVLGGITGLRKKRQDK